MNLNKVIIIGRMTADPELKTTPTGKSVVSFGVATNRYWANSQGGRQEETEFHNVVVWGRQAETVSQFLKKGALVMVEGRLQTRSWEGKDGQKRRTTEIVAQNIQFGPRSSGPGVSSFDGSVMKESEEEEREDRDRVPEIDIDDLGEDEDEIKGEDIFS